MFVAGLVVDGSSGWVSCAVDNDSLASIAFALSKRNASSLFCFSKSSRWAIWNVSGEGMGRD